MVQNNSMAETGAKDIRMKPKPHNILNVALFSALTAVGAYIRIPLPFSPVPITLQTMFTYMAGALLGGNLGALSQLIYVLLGVSGLPVFAGGNIGATGGYLVGFIVGAFVIGKLVEVKKNPSFLWLVTCMTAGTILIYALGVVQLMNWMRIDVKSAIAFGALPFIAGDSLKMLAAAYVIHRIKKAFPTLT